MAAAVACATVSALLVALLCSDGLSLCGSCSAVLACSLFDFIFNFLYVIRSFKTKFQCVDDSVWCSVVYLVFLINSDGTASLASPQRHF